MVIPLVMTVFGCLVGRVRHGALIKVQKQHVIRVDAQELVEQQEANNGPRLVRPGLLTHPGPGWTIEVFSPLLPRQLIEVTPVALLEQRFHLPHQQNIGMGVTPLVQQD